MASTQLIVTKQTALSIKGDAKEGDELTATHIVVKKTPFCVCLSFSGQNVADLDLNHIGIRTSLVYDNAVFKAVDFVRNNPLLTKESKLNPTATERAFDCSISTLSSQHESMLFRVCFQAYDTENNQEVAGLLTYSAPIKVISKPEVVHKREPRAKQTQTVGTKRGRDSELFQMLASIKETQDQQTAFLAKLKEKEHPIAHPISPEQAFITSFASLLSAYHQLPKEGRNAKVRRLIRSTSLDVSVVSDLLDLFWSDSGAPPLAKVKTNNNTSTSALYMQDESMTQSLQDQDEKIADLPPLFHADWGL